MDGLSYQFFTQPSSLWMGVRDLRLAVFVNEMKVPVELEIDELDKSAIHLSVQQYAKTIGTLRLVIKAQSVKLGRVVVHENYRRQGIGSQMMYEAIRYCEVLATSSTHLAMSEIILDAQTYVTDFYQALGFKQRGDIFDDAGIPHVQMYRVLGE